MSLEARARTRAGFSGKKWTPSPGRAHRRADATGRKGRVSSGPIVCFQRGAHAVKSDFRKTLTAQVLSQNDLEESESFHASGKRNDQLGFTKTEAVGQLPWP